MTSLPLDLSQVQAGKTYLVAEDYRIDAGRQYEGGCVVLPSGVTLIFDGGKLTSATPLTIRGNNTVLIAPIAQIFGRNVKAQGSWLIERAYPQWFEESPRSDSYPDSSDSIQSAIDMKGTGTVFLPAGDYYLDKPIYIPVGITLEGVTGQMTFKESEHQIDCRGTRLIPNGNLGRIIQKDSTLEVTAASMDVSFVVRINDDWEGRRHIEYANQWTALKGITFVNVFTTTYRDNKGTKIAIKQPMRCIHATGSVRITDVKWCDFVQAVQFEGQYADSKSITNCDFEVFDKTIIVPYDIYAFDLSGLGDAVEFRHNHITSDLEERRFLRLKQCAGGIIDDNIINGDVDIRQCKALTFMNNHMEYGAQLFIDSSVVSVLDSYIEKGSRHSVAIRSTESGYKDTYDQNGQCVVSMRNVEFIYFNRDRTKAEEKKTREGHNEKEERLNGICEGDIQIDRSAILTLDNVYRYDAVVDIGSVNPFGIKIDIWESKKKEGSTKADFRFNNYSYFMSQNGMVSRNLQLRANAAYSQLNLPFLHTPTQTEWVDWFREPGVYKYYYRIIWDIERDICRISGNKCWTQLQGVDDSGQLNTDGLIIINKKREDKETGQLITEGLLINSGVANGDYPDGVLNGYNYMVELLRSRVDAKGETIDDSIETVIFPLSGSRVMYDNGIAVCGYKWQTPTQQELYAFQRELKAEARYPAFETYSYDSGHVEATVLDDTPVSGTGWQKGDIIINGGSDSGWQTKVIK